MHPILTQAQDLFENSKAIPTAKITLEDSVRKMCEQNTCGQYGKNWTCPPNIKSVDEFRQEISSFDTCLVVYQVYDVKNSFDWRGMMAGAKDFNHRLFKLKKKIDTVHPDLTFKVLGAGGCSVCERCAYLDDEPCRLPDDAIVSMEACGINVMALMKDNGLKYYNGKNTVTYIGGVLFSNG